MRRYPCYININETEGYILSTGVEFKTFITALKESVNGFLFLAGYPENAGFDRRTCFEYVTQDDIPDFLEEDVYNYGDFCWADISESGDITKITDQEIAEMLFAAHLKRPFHHTFWDSIGNRYLYLCHDDEYWVKVYMKQIEEYKLVIEEKIRRCFIGRKRWLAPIPSEIMEGLYEFCTKGAIFDFENCTVSSIHTGVRIFPARDIGFCADDIHKELDHQRNIAGNGCYLEYNPRTKKWLLL